jgi:hypothetical protein
MRIYLAGRCDTDWRDSILGFPLSSLDIKAGNLAWDAWPMIQGCVSGRHDYVGPYPTDTNWDYHGVPSRVFSHFVDYNPNNAPGRFVRENLAAIDRCDALFAWLDRSGLYGTVGEIMYAHCKGKKVWIGIPGQIDAGVGILDAPDADSYYIDKPDYLVGLDELEQEYWWIVQLSQGRLGVDVSAKLVLESFLRPYELQNMPYADYLKTEHWQDMRRIALDRTGHKCALCASTSSLHVHHNTYERRGHELPTDLTVLCKSCHFRFHKGGTAE